MVINFMKVSQPTSTPSQLSSRANDFIGYFQDINILDAPSVEPAALAPFCAHGDFLNISGSAGCGKTSIAVDLLLAASHPGRLGKALGGLLKFPQEPFGCIKCAVLDAETSKGRWECLLAMKIRQEGLWPSHLGNIRYLQAHDFLFGGASERAQRSHALGEALGWDNRKLVIIDTLAMAWAPQDMNNPDWVFNGLSPFREECKRNGIVVIALTHTRRPSKDTPGPIGPIGTSYQENQADAQIIISRHRGSPPGIRLTHMKSRRSFWIQQNSVVDLRFTSKYSFEPLGNWQTSWPHDWPGQDSAPLGESDSTALRVEHLFGEANGSSLTTSHIASSLGVSERAARDHIHTLSKAGIIERVGQGPATKWRCVRR
jgi:hypothetical protein